MVAAFAPPPEALPDALSEPHPLSAGTAAAARANAASVFAFIGASCGRGGGHRDVVAGARDQLARAPVDPDRGLALERDPEQRAGAVGEVVHDAVLVCA